MPTATLRQNPTFVRRTWNDADASNVTVPPFLPIVAGVAVHEADGGSWNNDGERMITAHAVDRSPVT